MSFKFNLKKYLINGACLVHRRVFIYFKFINTITHLFFHLTRFVSCNASYIPRRRHKKKNITLKENQQMQRKLL